eukprot:jgi/Undpi1/2432/HiC_scaffold_13.g05813.m1
MIARLLGANVVLTEQDELLSLLDRNLADNFKGVLGEGIRYAALDWERKEDTDEILASLNPYAAAQPGRSCSSDNISEEGAAGQRPPTRQDFVLCADCVFEPLYGDSWKALAKVMGRLSDAGTTVLCSVERRGDDGVPRFLDACEAEGFERRMVYRSAKGAPSPIELYELTKGGQEVQAARRIRLKRRGDDVSLWI